MTRVIEIGGVAAAHAARLFADRGAEVIKVERPRPLSEAAEEQGALPFDATYSYFNAGKRFVTLDYEDPATRPLLRTLVQSADVLFLEDPPAGSLLHEDVLNELKACSSRLVIVAITGFGRRGPYSRFASGDLVGSAMGGILEIIGHDGGAPLRLPGHLVDVIVGTAAAGNAMMALLERDATATGRVVDVTVHQTVASLTTLTGVPRYLKEGVKGRAARENRGTPGGFFRTKDGYVVVAVTRPWIWNVLARWIHEVTGEEEILSPTFEGGSSARYPYAELIHYWVDDFTRRFTSEELMQEAQNRKIPIATVKPLADVIASEQLQSRKFFVDAEDWPEGISYPGPAYRTTPDSYMRRAESPAAGRDNAEVFKELAGASDEVLTSLSAKGLI